MITSEKLIRKYLSEVDGKISDVCADFYYSFIKDNPNSKENFSSFLKLQYQIPSNGTNEVKTYFDSKEYGQVIDSIKQGIFNMLNKIASQNLSPDEFYNELWSNTFCSPYFSSDIEYICVLILLRSSTLIPYYKMDEIEKMDDAEYLATANCIHEDILKAYFTLNYNFEQKTQIAAQLITIYNGLGSMQEKTVFMAQIIGYYQKQLIKLQNQINDLQDKIRDFSEQEK